MKTLPYTSKSFIYLAANEARKGDDPTRWNLDVEEQVKKLKLLREEYQINRKRFSDNSDRLSELRVEYVANRKKLRTLRDKSVQSAIDSVVDTLEEKLKTKTFLWGLEYGPTINGRVTFKSKRSIAQYLTSKQAEAVIRYEADLSPLSRNSIVRSLKDTISKQYAHAIIRLDIKNYFDSIDHKILLDMISNNGKIDSTSKYLVEQLLSEYNALTSNAKGLPQGIGLSSQLAEMYLSGFDKVIRTQPGVLYYARYVDDIVVVTETIQHASTINKQITKILNKLNLKKNPSKSYKISVNSDGEYPKNKTLEYLGYRFNRPVGSKILVTSLVKRRVDRRIHRLERAFEIWIQKNPDPLNPNTGNDGLLVNRVRYLAGNIKLHNSKSNVAVGIYYSNSALDPQSPQLVKLDKHLSNLITNNKVFMSSSLIKKLDDISFEEGFRNRNFMRFSQPKLDRITVCWRDIL